MGAILNILVPILAVFIVYKLFTTLGKNGEDGQNPNQRHDNRFDGTKNDDNSNVISLPTAKRNVKANAQRPDPVEVLNSAMEAESFANADEEAKQGLQKIIFAHPSFDYHEFMNGAEVAYEMINLGFAQNDRDILKRLLVDQVYNSFDTVMTAREAAGNRVVSRFVGYERVQLKSADVDGDMIRLNVHFVAKLVSTTYDKNDRIIEGDEKHIFNTNDVWTFENNMSDDNTSWKLAATAKG
ncbi:MAG: Tim44 domain-containing protein [Rhizobiales bacterium]|nr:Tim44 domain-containing protein [Hyphomicrobiales bacterium]